MKTPDEWLKTALVFAFDPTLDREGRLEAIRLIQADTLRGAADIAIQSIRPENSTYLTDAQAIRAALNMKADLL